MPGIAFQVLYCWFFILASLVLSWAVYDALLWYHWMKMWSFDSGENSAFCVLNFHYEGL